MACLILKTLILKSMRLVGALLWTVNQLIGVRIAKKDFYFQLKSEIKITPCNQTFYL